MHHLIVEKFELPRPEDLLPDAPLSIDDALWLPELGSRFSYRQLWTAIHAGHLPAERHGRTLYVTRNGVKEWRESCRVQPFLPASNSKANAAIRRQESSRIAVGGSSSIEGKSLARAAAQATVEELRRRLQTT